MLKVKLADNHQATAQVSSDGFLYTVTRDFYEFENTVRFFTNPTNGSNMNVNAVASGSSINVYDGGDNTYWTLSNIVGTGFANSTAQNHTPAGTSSLDFSGTSPGDIAQIKDGSTILSTQSTLSMWIYLTSWSKIDSYIEVYGYNTSLGHRVGNSIRLRDYINITLLNTWQNAIIPLADMNLLSQEIDGIRIYVYGSLPLPNGYIDDIQFIGGSSGGPYEYSIEPNQDEDLYITELTYALAGDYDNTLVNSNMPNISWNKLLNLTLSNGLFYRRFNQGALTYSVTWRNILEILSSPGSLISNYGSDGTSVFYTINYKFAEPTLLQRKYRDRLSIAISENLSSLNYFRVSANCKTRKIMES